MDEISLKKVVLAVLEEIDELLAGSEKCITQPDDPSGMLTEWVLDTEAFREKLQKRVEALRDETSA